MPRIAAGLAGLALLTLTACGTTPGATPTPTPTEAPPTMVATTPAPTATATATSDDSATPDSTANPTATAGTTATATATAGGVVTLPAKVETFSRVEQRSENDVHIGSYYSDGLKTVIEVRMARGKSVSEMLASVGGTNPTSIGGAQCSTSGDTICAREANGVAVVVSAKELPAGMVADLTSKFVAG